MLRLISEYNIETTKLKIARPSIREAIRKELDGSLVTQARINGMIIDKEETNITLHSYESDSIKFTSEIYVMKREEFKELEKILKEIKKWLPVEKQDLYYHAISLITKR